MEMHIALVPGDGIGPDIVKEAVKTIDKVAKVYGHTVSYREVDAGGVSIDKYKVPLTEDALQTAAESDAVLLGAVGGPKWDHVPGNLRPEKALLGLRSGLGLFCNLRPAVIYPELSDASPLKPSVIREGVDLLVVRELTGGIYFGEKGRSNDGKSAYDVMRYSVSEIERIARKAFEAARIRTKRVTVVDKANVLETSRLWRETVSEIAREYDDISLDFMYVDNASILSDEASMITGSIGMLASASLRDDKFGMYEPIHGSAPDIAGKNIANPIATILSAAMMFRYSFSLEDEAKAIENAVASALSDGIRTRDIAAEGEKAIGTTECGDEIIRRIG